MKRAEKGYSLIEVVVAVACFAILLLILVGLEREFIRFDRQMRVDFFVHPAPMSVVARLRRDVIDSYGYPDKFLEYEQKKQLLILDMPPAKGKKRTVVYDFTRTGQANRLEFVEEERVSSWTANAVPMFRVDGFEMPDGDMAVRIQAFDTKGRLTVDQIFQPRAGS